MFTPSPRTLTSLPIILAVTVAAAGLSAQSLTQFQNNTVANADEVNQNFNVVANLARDAQTAANQAIGIADNTALSVTPLLGAFSLGGGVVSVNGGLQLDGGTTAAAGEILRFGSANLNTDPIYFQRQDTAPNESTLRLILGDDTSNALDRFVIATRLLSATTDKLVFRSDGVFTTPLRIAQPGGYGFGLRLSRGTDWEIYHSGSFCSFANNGTRLAYIDDTNGNYVQPSDVRLKKQIEPMDDTLSRVMQLRPVTYRYKHQSDSTPRVDGLIAQDVQQLFPAAVSTSRGVEGEDDVLGISYGTLSVVALKAIQEQQTLIQQQSETIRALNERLTRLEGR